MKTIKYYLLFAFVMTLVTLQAEETKHPTPEDMQAKKWEYLVNTAKLSSTEAEQVKPIFSKYENGIWELHRKGRMRRERNTPPNYEDLNENYIERETKQAELLKEYHLELKNKLSPEVLHNYYKAENSYKRKLIYEMQNNHLKRKQGPPTHEQK